jgi:divalent metal cation (Fe/Co/Zn/Cd) transporter
LPCWRWQRRALRLIGSAFLALAVYLTAQSLLVLVTGYRALNAAAGWWWADPAAALVIVFYALREAREIFLA